MKKTTFKIGDLFRNVWEGIKDAVEALFDKTKSEWNKLTPEQQQALVDSSKISETIKKFYTEGAALVIKEVCALLGKDAEFVEPILLKILTDKFGKQIKSVQDGLDRIAQQIEDGVTSNGWKSLWDSLAKFAGGYLTNGKFDWASLAFGLMEFAYRAFVKNK